MEDQRQAENKIKVRIPPSPTGYMHIGTARTALFNYLFARHHNGTVVFRLEDTDKERSKPEFSEDIIANLRWLGIEWDEGPFYQSQRNEIYKKYLSRLVDDGKAYHCFCSQEELEARRQYQMSRGEAPKYSGKCAHISKSEAQGRLARGEKSVIRFRTENKKIKFNDFVRGEVEFDAALMGDFVIAKDMETALYNFIVTVDDFEMKITHVLRGEDILPNTPKQILIQEALGFSKVKYAHLPLLLGSDRAKLSKRHGAVPVAEYRRQGYLPEALINFIAFLGWNPGTEKEFYSKNELINDFSLEKIQKGGAIFNSARLDYINGSYLRRLPVDELARLCIPYFIEAGLAVRENNSENPIYKNPRTGEKLELNFFEKIAAYQQTRLKKLSEIAELSHYFFTPVLNYQKELLKWKESSFEETKFALDELKKMLSKLEEGDWDLQNLEQAVLPNIVEYNLSRGLPEKDRGYLLWPLRVALCGQKMSIGPFEMADVLGKKSTLERIDFARELLNGSVCRQTLFE